MSYVNLLILALSFQTILPSCLLAFSFFGHVVKETEVNSHLMSGFMLIWLEVGLYLMFAVSVRYQKFQIPLASFFLSPLLTLRFSKYFSESKSCNPFKWNSLLFYWSQVDLVVRYEVGISFYNLIIKSQSFNWFVSLSYDLHECILSSSSLLG